ncbi:MAG: ROK family protein [Coprobacillus sp.]
MKYLGVDIGGTAVKLGIVDEVGNILCKASYDVSFDQYKTPIIDTVLKSIDLFLKENQETIEHIEKIGVSATGQIDTTQGKVIGVGGNIANWDQTPIQEIFERVFQKKTTVVNDANCMIIGEKWIGSAKDKNQVIGITIGTGVGGGIIVNGEILLGHVGIAGELGHFSIDRNGIECSCGNVGCYERYAATTALIKMVKDKYNDLDIKESIDDINGKLIFDYVHNGNKKIADIVDEWLDNIAAGLISLTHIFNPEMIVLGGGVCQQEELFLKPLQQKVLDKVMPRFKEQLEIKAAKLGNDAGLIGAVYYAIKH